MIRDIPLTRPGWGWGRNGELANPAFVTIRSGSVQQAGTTEVADGVLLSVYSRRGYAQGSSPIDLHLNDADALAVADAIRDAVNRPCRLCAVPRARHRYEEHDPSRHDWQEAARDDRLVPIISEYDGGIVAYALRGHEVALVAALNVPAAEVEYRQRQRDEDRKG